MEQQKLDILATSPGGLRSPTREPLVPEGELRRGSGLEGLEPDVRRRQCRDRFGLLCFQPDWLQVFRNAKFFTLLLCLFSLVEGAIISGSVPVSITSLEKRFGFSGVEVGSIGLPFELAIVLSVVFVSYFSERSHKPRWLAVGLILQGIASFLFVLPHLIFGQYQAGTSQFQELCAEGVNSTSPDCRGANYYAYGIFTAALFLLGIGAAPLFTIGTSFLDDIVRPRYVPLYMGVFLVTIVFGPVIGFLFGGVFLSIYVDIGVETALTPEDPSWVGAWWIPFIITGLLSFLIAMPFLAFPRQLPDSDEIKAERMKEMAKVMRCDLTQCKTFKEALRAFPLHLKHLLANVSYICLCLALGTMFILISGQVDFAAKYIESQFSMTASNAAFVVGGIAVTSAGFGILAGGVIIYLLKIRGRRLPLMMTVFQAVALPLTFIYLLTCPTPQIPGITTPYADGSETLENATCLSSCDCNSALYEPVCGSDGHTYISPCWAGCESKLPIEGTDMYHFENCTCLNSTNLTAVEGMCDGNCSLLIPFVLVVGIQLILLYTIQIPIVFTTIRVVAEEQRTLALGFQSVVWRVMGTIPGPLFFGALFDSSCEFWQNDCGQRGNCWVYNNQSLGRLATITGVTALGAALAFFVAAWITYPKQRDSGGTSGGTPRVDFDDSTETDGNAPTQGKKPPPLEIMVTPARYSLDLSIDRNQTGNEETSSPGGIDHETVVTQENGGSSVCNVDNETTPPHPPN